MDSYNIFKIIKLFINNIYTMYDIIYFILIFNLVKIQILHVMSTCYSYLRQWDS